MTHFLCVGLIMSIYNMAMWDFKKLTVLRYNLKEPNPIGYQKCALEPSLSL